MRDSEITRSRPRRDPPIGVTPSDAPGRAVARAHGRAMRRCVGNHAVFVLEFSPDGRLSEILSWDGETPDERLCLARSLGNVRLEPAPGRQTHVRFDLAPNEPRRASSVHGTSGNEVPAPSAPSVEPPVAQSVRATLDRYAADVLTCTGTDRAAVRVEWTSAPATTLSLGGDLAGSPAEQCVRSALSGRVEVPASTPAGVVVHLVHSAD